MSSIRKIEVTRGIHWVEIPAADLRIVCGCPADTVKHLKKRGLIVPVEIDGRRFETGPNAILLPDGMLQNGQFANLTEFPILQMLYMQGMLGDSDAGHGRRRPLLLGHSDQLGAQLEYIHRGNYGLLSEEELERAGASAEQAREWMRLKRAFAVGRIRSPLELVDMLEIGPFEAHVRDGVTVRREDENRYRIGYRGESVSVDLRLDGTAGYPPPYPLNYQKTDQEYFSIVHTGDGDGWDVNRPCMSSLVIYQGDYYLIDAGPNLEHTLDALGISGGELEGIFQTHAHDDHFAGIPSLIRGGKRLKYFATPQVRAATSAKLAALLDIDPEEFDAFFEVHDLALDEWNDLGGLEVRPMLSPHPVETTILVFRTLWQDGYRSYGHLADIAAFRVLDAMVEEDPARDGLSSALLAKVKADYLQPLDLKKIDAGGGAIHGDATDFADDRSRKIILSHSSRPFSDRERQIGSTASFGTCDVLISGTSNFVRRNAFDYLSTYFPTAPLHHLRLLLNGEVHEANPGTILIHRDAAIDDLYLVLTGSVEMLEANAGIRNVLGAGTLIGDEACLEERHADATYRSVGYARLLRIPAPLFRTFIARNGLLDDVMAYLEQRTFLQGTRLFGDGLDYLATRGVAADARLRRLPAGATVALDDPPCLRLVRTGSVVRELGPDEHETLHARDSFGEEMALFDTPSLFPVTVAEECELLEIPGDTIRAIPIVRWKLLERTHHLLALATRDPDVSGRYRWQDAFAIGDDAFDRHHSGLFDLLNRALDALDEPIDRTRLAEVLDELHDYTIGHFAAEEARLVDSGYDGVEEHRDRHRRLHREAAELRDAFACEAIAGWRHRFRGYCHKIVQHVLLHDRRWAAALAPDRLRN